MSQPSQRNGGKGRISCITHARLYNTIQSSLHSAAAAAAAASYLASLPPQHAMSGYIILLRGKIINNAPVNKIPASSVQISEVSGCRHDCAASGCRVTHEIKQAGQCRAKLPYLMCHQERSSLVLLMLIQRKNVKLNTIMAAKQSLDATSNAFLSSQENPRQQDKGTLIL